MVGVEDSAADEDFAGAGDEDDEDITSVCKRDSACKDESVRTRIRRVSSACTVGFHASKHSSYQSHAAFSPSMVEMTTMEED